MSISDPVHYPLPINTAEGAAQDAVRIRTELSETLAELGSRWQPVTYARRRAVRRTPALMMITGGLVAAGALRRRPRSARSPGSVAGAAGLALLTGGALWPRHRAAGGVLPSMVARPRDVLPPSPPGGDVVDVLITQHRHILRTFDRVTRAHSATARREAFAALVELLHRHEKSEQTVVHAAMRRAGGATAQAAEEREAEERQADRLIANIASRGVKDRDFDRLFGQLKAAVKHHAEREESVEFPLLRRSLPDDVRRSMANQVLAAQPSPW